MATKEELVKENAELRGKLAELEDAADAATETWLKDIFGDEWDVAVGAAIERAGLDVAAWEELDVSVRNAMVVETMASHSTHVDMRVRDEEGEFAEPEEGALYRYDGSGDFVKSFGGAGDGEANARIEMLVQDVTRLEIERNDARNEVVRLKAKIGDMGSLHGRVDNLPPVV